MLLASLFLTWSHQFPPGALSVQGMRVALAGVPRSADAWQVYSVSDALLAALAVALAAAALRPRGRLRAVMLVLAAVALAFCMHARSVPPTSGVDLVRPGTDRYLRSLASAGSGEMVAIVALGLSLLGLVVAPERPRA